MNVPAIAVVVLALAQSDTTALVEAAKEAKAKRKGSTTKVITNSDVKKADKSKVKVRTDGGSEPVVPQPTLIEKHAAERKARAETEEKLKALTAAVAELEAELAKLEQTYYDTNDLHYRDTEIVRRFNETKAKLDAARAQRNALRPEPTDE